MKSKCHIWELIPNAIYDIRVEIKEKFKQKLLSKLPKSKTEIIKLLNETNIAQNRRISISHSRWFNWFKYNDVKIPLWVLLFLSRQAKISKSEMEKNISLYKLRNTPTRVSVNKPILPVKLKPELVSLAAHFCFDGSLPKDGKGSFYSQKNRSQVNTFLEKVKNCFGATHYVVRLDRKKVHSVRLPRIIVEACKHIFEFRTFASSETRIPEKVIKSSKKFRLAFLVSAIVDEGGIGTEYIQIMLKNRSLTEDLRQLCLDLNYNCTKLKSKKNYEGVYYFYIKSARKLYSDVEKLRKKIPTISFGFKKKRIEYLVRSKNFLHGKHTAETATKRKKAILHNLKEPKSSFELSNALKAPARSTRRYLLQLVKEGEIKRIKLKHAYFYQLTPLV